MLAQLLRHLRFRLIPDRPLLAFQFFYGLAAPQVVAQDRYYEVRVVLSRRGLEFQLVQRAVAITSEVLVERLAELCESRLRMDGSPDFVYRCRAVEQGG